MRRRSAARAAGGVVLLGAALGASSCGYRAVYGGAGQRDRLHVRLVRTLVPDAVASDEVVSGVREQLAEEGLLEGGEGWPRVEVEVLRADDVSVGIHDEQSAPLARGLQIALLGRAWIAASADAPHQRDTGDLAASEDIAVDLAAGAPDPRAAAFRRRDALRAAARRLGQKLTRRLLGEPAASDERFDR